MNTQAVAVLAVFFCSQISLLIVTEFPGCTMWAKEKRVGKKDFINDK